MIESLLETIGNSAIGLHIAEDAVAFPWIEVGHVLSLTVVFGSIMLVDLRLLGIAWRDYPVGLLNRTILPITWLAFIGAAITGALLFTSNPLGYYGNLAFRAKAVLLLLAGLNMVAFHLAMRGGRLDRPGPLPARARFAASLSILIWIGVIACGRWIGFTMDPF